MKTIIISGTPGTGKSTLAGVLAKKLGFQPLDLKKLVKKISEGYDRKKQCSIIDIKKLNREIINIIKKEKKNLIISSHLIHHLPPKYADLCLITRCSSLKTLRKRLEKKGYSKAKVRENLDCEIFAVCLNEAREAGHKVLIVDTCKRIDWKDLTKKIKSKLKDG